MREPSFVYANARLAFCLTVTRNDEVVLYGTDATFSIAFAGGPTFTRWAGCRVGDVTEANDGTTPGFSFDVSVASDAPLKPRDIDNDLYRGARVLLEVTDADNPVTRDFRFVGTVGGDIKYDLAGNATFECLSLFADEREVAIRTNSYECDAIFGDPLRCKMATFANLTPGSKDLHDIGRSETLAIGDRRRFDFDETATPDRYHNVYFVVTGITTGVTASSAPVYSDVPDDTVVDGGVTLTVRNALARAAQIGSVVDARNVILTNYSEVRAAASDWLVPGRFKVCSGYCRNMVVDVEAYDAGSGQIQLEQPIGDLLAVNDWIEIAPDCTHLPDMCDGKYANMFNYRGLVHVTGGKLASSTVVDGTTPMPGPDDDPTSTGGVSYVPFAVEFLEGAG